MDRFNYPKSPFMDPDSDHSNDDSSIKSVNSAVQLPPLNVKPAFNGQNPSLRFDLPSNLKEPSPFSDRLAYLPPSSPLASETFPAEDEPMKRHRWGTTRHPTGRPKKENVNRSKTLKRIFQPRKSLKDTPHDSTNTTTEDVGLDSFDIIDEYASDNDIDAGTGAKRAANDRKHEEHTIVFNRPLPDHLLDAETGLPATDYPRNKIRSAKYTALSFFPKNIGGQFLLNIANVYFLFLIILGFFSIFGVPSPALAAVPLIVIMVMTALKDAVEDSRRTATDMEVNNQPTHILAQVAPHPDYVYVNRNVNDENVSLWRRFKKWNTKVMFRGIRASKRNLTKDGRALKKREQHKAEARDDPVRKSFDSAVVDNPRDSTYSMARVATNPFRKSMQSRRSYHPRSKTLAFEKKSWKEVKVGDILRVQNNEEIPADLLILSSSDDDNCCFVETKNLDGETNLKVKQALKFSTDAHKLKRADDFMDVDFEVESEGPHPNLYSYQGFVTYNEENQVRKETVTINNMILRGCSLRNTKWVIGMVIFTGPETKIILNSGVTPTKKSRISRGLNYYVILNFVVLFVVCFISGLANGLYYKQDNVSRSFFEYGTIAGSPAVNGLVTFFVAVILYQALVPISLYITIEIIKSMQAYFIYSDVGLYYDKLDFPCTPKSWSISDDLGQVEYIFSDKTGTLTQNLMEFRKCTINGVSYGRAYTEALAGLRKRQGIDVEEESRIEKEFIAQDRIEMLEGLRSVCENTYDDDLTFVSKEFVDDLKGKSGVVQKDADEEFMLALALCHSVLVEEDPKNPGKKVLKAQSPDEAALVGTARGLGFEFSDNTKRGFIVTVQGKRRNYQVLNTLEFNSTRKRMSAIIKLPSENKDDEPKVLLLCKGADSIIYSRLSATQNQASLLDTTSAHLEEFAVEGLRTLCIAKRELTWSQYLEWNERHQEASSSLVDREDKMEAVADSIERELVLLGGTAIEDRLQDGVPDSIALLADAGIKLWVLTGDKVETAINIGFSCNLLGNDMELLILKTDLSEDEKVDNNIIPGDDNLTIIDRLITSYLMKFFKLTGSKEELEEALKDHSAPNDKFGVVIDGDALKLALANDDIKRKFLLLCKQCKAVLCCRVSPAQKAAVVKMVKDTLDVMTLAIGDGSNDVAMIQAADVGVGIAGEEGRQAAMSSDYALGQFRFLTRLLLTHGRWSYKRFSEMIPSFFHKNVSYTFALFWYSIANNFDGSYLFEYTYLMFYNLAFTAFPVIFLAVFDQDVSASVSMLVPQLYRSGITQSEYTEAKFWFYVSDGFYQALISFFFPYLIYLYGFQTENGLATDHRFFLGVFVTCISCFASNCYVWMHQYRWDYLSFLALLVSILLIFTWTGIWTSITISSEFYKAAAVLFGLPLFWACVMVGLFACLIPRFFFDILQKLYYPKDTDIIRECVGNGDYDMYPQDYDPTDPDRVAVGLPKMNEGGPSSLLVSSEMKVTAPVKPRSIFNAFKRQTQVESYYHDNTSIIDTYSLNNVSTNDLGRMLGMSEEIPMKDLRRARTSVLANNRNSVISRQPTNIRTSLELNELTTLRSLKRASLDVIRK